MTQRGDSTVADLEIVTRGDLPAATRADAERSTRELARYVHRPILHARVRVERSGDPARLRPVTVQINLDVAGRPVRVQVAAATAAEAIDLAHERMRHRLERLERYQEKRPPGTPQPGPHEWRHGQEPAHRPDVYPRPAGQRQVVRHKAYEPPTCTLDEALFDMDLMDYDFHLFTDASCGRDAVVYRGGPTGYRVAYAGGPPGPGREPAVPVTVSPYPPVGMALPEAIDRLDTAGWPFLFFTDPGTGRGRLLYRRYDGHYGLVTPPA
jgi:ribosome-associated translation inhibitor RaiA